MTVVIMGVRMAIVRRHSLLLVRYPFILTAYTSTSSSQHACARLCPPLPDKVGCKIAHYQQLFPITLFKSTHPHNTYLQFPPRLCDSAVKITNRPSIQSTTLNRIPECLLVFVFLRSALARVSALRYQIKLAAKLHTINSFFPSHYSNQPILTTLICNFLRASVTPR
jgi:hypothetical protein